MRREVLQGHIEAFAAYQRGYGAFASMAVASAVSALALDQVTVLQPRFAEKGGLPSDEGALE